MSNLSGKIKKQVFDEILAFPKFLGNYSEYDGILTFLSKIWPLKEMPSEDPRYKNAYDDANQHVVNNDDWTYEYLFVDRFKLIDGDDKYFVLFLESLVHPTVRVNKDEIIALVSKINQVIQSSGSKLVLTSYFEESPVYKLKEDSEDLPTDIMINTIPIYLASFIGNKTYPCFVLRGDNWNDYGLKTLFQLSYYADNTGSWTSLGDVKIMKRGNGSTFEVLDNEFKTLPVDFCSLGQDGNYYKSLKNILGFNFSSFLLGLRDVAIFPKIYEQFEDDSIFKTSLLRFNEAERLTRTIRYEIEGISSNEYYKFSYAHQPPYADNKINLNFDFEFNTDFEHRVYAVIGKNGTGKTRLLSALAKSLSEKNPAEFSPRKPTYGKVFTVSYSFFDRFEIPNSDASFNYIYCGLKNGNNSFKTEDELLEQFYRAANLIVKREFDNKWIDVLRNFLSEEIIQHLKFKRIPIEDDKTRLVFDHEEFGKVKSKLSSGQSILLYMISEILSQIRYDSLILFDEPETHLHPNAISALVNTIFELVRGFQSFCVIATHSPIIIQEIPARNIFVIEREDTSVNVRELEHESYGENLTVITQDIFGNREVPKYFISVIEELIQKEKSFSEIVSILESDNLPISSNVRLYIKALLKKN